MHAGRSYSLSEYIIWSKRSIYYLLSINIIAVLLYECFNVKWLSIPWAPVTLIGTAAAFILGFRNNATYARSWEARKIWGSIVNSSRTWAVMAKDFVQDDKDSADAASQLIHRHIAWLTALRFQLRQPKVWENVTVQRKYQEYRRKYVVPEWDSDIHAELGLLLSGAEMESVQGKSNFAAQILAMQSKHIAALNAEGRLETLKYVEMVRVIEALYNHQGANERIKNFPYPRQFASISTIFIHLFVLMVPLGILKEFDAFGNYFVWLTIPFSVVVSWVFIILEYVGESTESPFEGGANDIPISALCRSIEIELRQMLQEEKIPLPLQPVHNILM